MAFGEVKAMAMQGSSTEDSYAQNSNLQNYNFHALAKPVLAKAVEHVVSNIAQEAPHRRHVAVADLGCSYGSNTLDCARFIVEALQQSWAGGAGSCDDEEKEIHYFFSDLPSNDFNALFQSLQLADLHPPPPAPMTSSAQARPRPLSLYAAGVPGSFHGRLFPSASLDLVTCSYALHWLSQVPPSLIDKSSLAWNGGRTWTNTASETALDAYARQSAIDVKSFLNFRTHELASGGIMFLLLGSIPNKEIHQKIATWELFDSAWREMVAERIITTEEMDMFNMPMYMFNQHELEVVLMDIPQLKVLHMETKESLAKKEAIHTLEQWFGYISSTTKPVIEAHLGKYKTDKLFARLKAIAPKQEKYDSLVICPHVLVATLQRV